MRRRSRAAGGMVWRAFSDLSNGTVQSGMLLGFFERRSDCSNKIKLLGPPRLVIYRLTIRLGNAFLGF